MTSGVLVMVVGPSGAGKDTLLGYARAKLANSPGYIFARRLITRSTTDANEDFEACNQAEFEAAVERGDLALHWRAHGTSYGIRSSLLADIRRRHVVIASVSRTVVDSAVRLCPQAVIVQITASPRILAERLQHRGRESVDDIARRLERAMPLPVTQAPIVTISNEGPIEFAGRAFTEFLLAQLRPETDGP